MSRYFLNPKADGWEGDYDHWSEDWEKSHNPSLDVSDHVAKFTGLYDATGSKIYKEPRTVGFGRNID